MIPANGRRPPLAVALGGLAALAAAIGIGRFVYTPILPPMVADLGLTKGAAGLLASANFAGYLAGAVAGSLALPKGYERTVMLAALLASAATTALMAIPDGLWPLLALRFAGGLASALVLVLATTLVLERLNAGGHGALSDVHFAGVGAGITLSALLVAAVAGFGGNWREMWLAAGALAFVGLIAVWRLVPPPEAVDPGMTVGGSSRQSDGSPKQAGLARFVVAYGLFGFGYVITATFLVAIVRADATMRALEPIVWVVVGLTAVPSVGVWGRIGRRIGIGKAFAIACLIEAIGIVGCVWPGGPLGAMTAALMLGATLMGITALGLMGGRLVAPANPQRTFALMTAAFGLGQIIGPLVAGYAYDRTGTFVLPTLAAVSALLAAAAVVPRNDMAAQQIARRTET